jgi:predicted Ser/Thr protein kinase
MTVGTQIAGYRLEEEVGRGGMGVVYRAHDLALERPVALKLLAPRLAEDPDFRERFLVESRLAASLDHPNVVPVYDAGEVEGQLYLAMRFVEGTDLKRLLKDEGTVEPARAIAVCAQMANALDAAHAPRARSAAQRSGRSERGGDVRRVLPAERPAAEPDLSALRQAASPAWARG